ncbi:MAG: L,D-transpeptidase [Gordonia sp. (in: high G+C Gram-positive bacteria)]
MNDEEAIQAPHARGWLRDYAAPAALAFVALGVTVMLLLTLGDRRDAPVTTSDAPRHVAAKAMRSAAPAQAVDLCHGNTAARIVIVSLSVQSMSMCEHGTQVANSPVTTGRVAYGAGTPLGTWRIDSRETNRYLNGPNYRVFVHYWLPFFRDFGFHDSSWQRFPYGDRTLYKKHGSLGCVHVPESAMVKLYDWVHVGTMVSIIR